MGIKEAFKQNKPTLKKYASWLMRVVILYLLLTVIKQLFAVLIDIEVLIFALESEKQLKDFLSFIF